MTPSQIIQKLQEIIEEHPAVADKEVLLIGPYGSSDEIVCINHDHGAVVMETNLLTG